MKFDKPIQDGLKNRKISEKKKKKFSTIFAEMFKIVHSATGAQIASAMTKVSPLLNSLVADL